MWQSSSGCMQTEISSVATFIHVLVLPCLAREIFFLLDLNWPRTMLSFFGTNCLKSKQLPQNSVVELFFFWLGEEESSAGEESSEFGLAGMAQVGAVYLPKKFFGGPQPLTPLWRPRGKC